MASVVVKGGLCLEGSLAKQTTEMQEDQTPAWRDTFSPRIFQSKKVDESVLVRPLRSSTRDWDPCARDLPREDSQEKPVRARCWGETSFQKSSIALAQSKPVRGGHGCEPSSSLLQQLEAGEAQGVSIGSAWGCCTRSPGSALSCPTSVQCVFL